MLSSPTLRAQLTADKIAKKVGYKARIHYMEELYRTTPEIILNILSLQDNNINKIFLVGHNPELTELGNMLTKDFLGKLPTMSVVAIELKIKSWEELGKKKGKIDFFIYPKQFEYYMPKQIRTIWDKQKAQS